MKKDTNADFYFNNKKKFLSGFDFISKRTGHVFEKHFGSKLSESVIRDFRNEFDKIINELPYIGGFKNDHTWYLLSSTLCLSAHKAMKKQGKTVEESGQIIYEIADALFESLPRFVTRYGGKIFFHIYFKRLLKQSADTHKREHPYNWVFDVFKGNGIEYDFGVDYHECFICRFFKEQGEEELIPYMCVLDYIISETFGWGLVRTQTIYNGDKACNFRYKKGRPSEVGWPKALNGMRK